MGKRIIQQRRGRGTSTYRVSKRAFRYKIGYPQKAEGEGTVVKIFNSAAHSAPLAKVAYSKGSFYIPAFKKMVEGQKIKLSGTDIKDGNIVKLKDVPVKTNIYCVESRLGDGGTFINTGGNWGVINRVVGKNILVTMPSKKDKKFNEECRAIIGRVAGAGRLDKPVIKAGKKHYIKKAKSKLWPRTSAVKMNAIDHPFGSGRAKNVKSKIAKRNSPPGKKVGLIRPKRTGHRK